LGAAQKDFLAAAKYAEHANTADCARSFGLAGWAFYCDGDVRSAESNLRRSIAINPADSASLFNLSKILFHNQHATEARRYLAKALRVDKYYGIRAAADPDFLANRADVLEVVEEYRAELRNEVSKTVSDCEGLSLEAKHSTLQRYECELSAELADLRRMRESIQVGSIADQLLQGKSAPGLVARIRQKVLLGKENIERQILALESASPMNLFAGYDHWLVSFAPIYGGILGLWWYVGWVHSYGEAIFPANDPEQIRYFRGGLFNYFQPLWALIVAAFFSAIAPLLMAHAVLPLTRIPKKARMDNDRSRLISELRSDLRRLIS
jgi:hypothetical protein